MTLFICYSHNWNTKNEKNNKKKYKRFIKWIVEADPDNCTDPEKLPKVLGVWVVLDTATFLQVPKGAPACTIPSRRLTLETNT